MAEGHLLGWQPRHFIFFDYACRADRTEVQLNDEAEAYVWATVDEALRLPVEPYTERAIRAYLAQQAGSCAADARPAT